MLAFVASVTAGDVACKSVMVNFVVTVKRSLKGIQFFILVVWFMIQGLSLHR